MNQIKNNKNLGIILIITSSLFFSLMATAVKSVNHFPLAEKVFFRNFIGLIFLSIPMIKDRGLLKVTNKKLMFGRAFLGTFGVFLFYNSVLHLHLSEAMALNKLSPFFIIILSGLFLKEKIKPAQIIAVFVAIGGLMVILNPKLNIPMIPALLGLTGAFCAGAAYTMIRQLRLTDHPSTIVFYFCLFSSVTSLPIMLSNFIIPTGIELLKLCLIGLMALGGQLAMTNAYRYAPASQLSIYTYLNIVFSSLWGFLFYGESLTLSFMAGAGLIIFAGYINFMSSNDKMGKRKKKAAVLTSTK
ncbi:EamA domain-containing membrane protein RarD [Dethiosulfatibacter aminovorans DSM 17477]|uniref:EamA domain-containing membrane protein RarD n=1 Tax=Dethiosulfatibacter aminovorans DSM 17477 TaxID=1121476 RepID=A0A1M6L0R8_9FIRM|nr:DMT family transporter [Dethiosulfatibacter aminovorans]SHJ64798.1 EamA domain-containing membrane protein RarD [Dethiosulfatibacter aminovorans DSM 17477]